MIKSGLASQSLSRHGGSNVGGSKCVARDEISYYAMKFCILGDENSFQEMKCRIKG